MKIVVLDGYAANPGDLSWDKLSELGELKVYDRLPNETDKIVEAIGTAEIILTNKTPITSEVLSQTTNLKYVGVLATGYNVVDINYAKNRGIVVTNIPAYSTPSVVQHTFALILEVCMHVGEHSRSVHNGDWLSSKDFCYWNYPLIELQGKTLGIIGFGKIGQQVATVANAFGMKVLFSSRTPKQELETPLCKNAKLEDLLAESDFISLHTPLTDETAQLINKETISKMKDGVVIINTSRGGVIEEKDLAEALNIGKVAYAAVDVVSSEPMENENPLLSAKNIIITPHIAWAPKESRIRLMNIAVENVKAFIEGNAINVVNQ